MDQVSELPKKLTSFNLNQLDQSDRKRFEPFVLNHPGYKKSLFAQEPKETKNLTHLHHYNHLNEEAITFQRQILLDILENTKDSEAIVIKARRKQDDPLFKEDKNNG